jgi:hypothetical protein
LQNSELTPLGKVKPGVERHLRLDLRVLLNKGDGTWSQTNAVADELAMHILRNFKVEEK